MLLTMNEKKRIDVIQMVMDERLEIGEAARGLGRSERHTAVRDLSEMFGMFTPDKDGFTDQIVEAFLKGRIL